MLAIQETTGYQGVERTTAGKEPAQLDTAAPAQTKLPVKTRKPAELAAFSACNLHARSLRKTANVKNHSAWVKKHMPVPAVDTSSLPGIGQR